MSLQTPRLTATGGFFVTEITHPSDFILIYTDPKPQDDWIKYIGGEALDHRIFWANRGYWSHRKQQFLSFGDPTHD